MGVGLGVWITPYIESRKLKSESQYMINCFYSEVEDYFIDAPSFVRNYHSGYSKVIMVETGKTTDTAGFFPIRFSPKIEFITIKPLLDKSFLELTSDQRKAIKALISLSRKINENAALLAKGRGIDDFTGHKSKFWSTARMCASFYYLLSRLHHEKERFTYLEETNEEMCKKALDALELSSEFKDLLNPHA